MTERVTIEGLGLTITRTRKGKPSRVDEDDIGIDPDPKRRRPPAIPKARHDGRAKTTGRTLDEVRTQPNPYWTDEENHAAEQAG